MEAGEKWQLSVIPADFRVPDFAPGAVMYQIFPDRFARSGSCDLTCKLQPFWVHESPDELPEYRPDAQGEVRNNDFFGGNFAGICEKLPYLQELGVGVLYLNPIFMAWSNHRYDTADYRRPDPMLGTEEDFRTLCDEAHARGMRVILDGVFSHTGSNSVYFDAKHVFGHGAVSDPNSPYRRWYRFRHYPDDYEAWWGIRTLPCVEELDETYLHYIIEDETPSSPTGCASVRTASGSTSSTSCRMNLSAACAAGCVRSTRRACCSARSGRTRRISAPTAFPAAILSTASWIPS